MSFEEFEDSSPVAPRRPAGLVVFGLGLVTSAIALTVVYYCLLAGFDPMHWYLWFIVPVGALLVGLVAGSGYTFGSLWTQYRPSASFVGLIFVFQLFIYFAAQYLSFDQAVRQAGGVASFQLFLEWYQITIESLEMAFGRNQNAVAMGKWGYLYELLRIIGFAGGSLIPLAWTTGPYCESCGRYMKKRATRFLPSAAVPRKIKKKDTEAQAALDEEHRLAAEAAQAKVQALTETIASEDHDRVMTLLGEIGDYKQTPKVPAHVQSILHRCETCDNYHVALKMLIQNGDNVQTQDILAYQKKP